ncbi:protein I'm not dead yet-like [Prorops nasuta]|uniref:protein I'm not dead yet-like n=1 Tax=Prorops nasuta TaxID=863751 RepID=UPI0034CF6479
MNVRTEDPRESRTSEINVLTIFLMNLGHFLKIYWKNVFAICWPLFLSSIIFTNATGTEYRCGFIISTMAGYWVTECFPLAVTSLIPVVLFPAMGIMSTADTCICYMNDTIMVFLGGLTLALAIEHSNLHLRIALGVMKTVGCSHSKLLGGLCFVTTVASMWISNTGATAMMVPIIFAVLSELEQAGLGRVFLPEDPSNPGAEPKPTKITRAYLLSTAYCATFGGTGTIVGTGTNLTFKGIYENFFPEAKEITFGAWILAFSPQMIVNSFLTWVYLRVAFFGLFRPKSRDARNASIGVEGEEITNQVIQQRFTELGPMSFHEKGVAVLFILCVLLWLLRQPGYMPGWAQALTSISIKDSAPVMLVAILLFLIPKDLKFLDSFRTDITRRPERHSEGLITWKVIEKKMPWSLMFLLGAGFAIAKASKVSCLARTLGTALAPLKVLPPFSVLFIVAVTVSTFSEITSNVGIANIVLPVVAQMCVVMELHPLYLMLPATLAGSYAFRLPAGTPPNAIIALQGHIPTKWLIQGGMVPAIYSIIMLLIFFPTWISYILNIHEFPEWARHVNRTDLDENSYNNSLYLLEFVHFLMDKDIIPSQRVYSLGSVNRIQQILFNTFHCITRQVTFL